MRALWAGRVAQNRAPSSLAMQYIEVIQGDKDFYGLWEAVLRALQASMCSAWWGCCWAASLACHHAA